MPDLEGINHPKVTEALIQLYNKAVDFIQFRQPATLNNLIAAVNITQKNLKEFGRMRPVYTIDVESTIIYENQETTTTTTTSTIGNNVESGQVTYVQTQQSPPTTS
jgi:hypothetical protein